MSVLDCLFNAVTQILRKNVDKKALFDNLEVAIIRVFLASQDALEVMGVSEYGSVSTDLTDVTLVSDDTY